MLDVEELGAVYTTVLVVDARVEVRLRQPISRSLAVIKTANIHLFDLRK